VTPVGPIFTPVEKLSIDFLFYLPQSQVDNVFWETLTGRVTLLDFGLATFFQDGTLLNEPWGCVK